MCYNRKYLLLSIILISFLFNQSYFNRILGSKIINGDASSFAIGNTYLTTQESSNLVFSNPARLSLLKSNIVLDFQFNYLTLNERKSIIVKDFFGGNLGYADIAFNQTSLYNYSLGAAINFELFKNYRVSLAYSQKPFISFNYSYEEEIRSQESFNNYNTILDPIVGFHILKTAGNLDLQTIGVSFAYGKENPYAVGVSINRIPPSKIKDSFYTTIVSPDIDSSNLSTIYDEVRNIYDIYSNKDYFLTYSLDFPIGNHLRMIYSIEEDIIISSEEYSHYQFSSNIGLPLLMKYQGFCQVDSEPISVNTEEACLGVVGASWNYQLSYPLEGLYYEKPKTYNFGLLLKPKGTKNMSIAFEFTEKKINQYIYEWDCSNVEEFDNSIECNDNNYDSAIKNTKILNNNIFELRIGLEHFLKNKFPLRAGFIYSEPIFEVLEPKTTITLGTGTIINNISIDFAMDYSIDNYRYYDIFPISNVFENTCESDQNCNKVKESKLNFLTTIKIGF